MLQLKLAILFSELKEYLFLFSTASCLYDAYFFLILWPGINVDSHVVLTVFHFVTVNIVKRKVLFQGYTWCEWRIENRSFPGSRISACNRFRIPNFLIFSICFSSFHLFIISAIYIITIVICSRLKPQTENLSYVQNPGYLENKS